MQTLFYELFVSRIGNDQHETVFDFNFIPSTISCWFKPSHQLQNQDGVIYATLDDGSFYINCEFTTDDNECQLRHYYDGRENVFTSNNENSFSLRKNAITTYFCYNYLLMILQFSEDNVSIFMLTTL